MSEDEKLCDLQNPAWNYSSTNDSEKMIMVIFLLPTDAETHLHCQ